MNILKQFFFLFFLSEILNSQFFPGLRQKPNELPLRPDHLRVYQLHEFNWFHQILCRNIQENPGNFSKFENKKGFWKWNIESVGFWCGKPFFEFSSKKNGKNCFFQISLIFQEIKVIPVEKDTETPILSQKKFQEILEKCKCALLIISEKIETWNITVLPKIMEKCKNRENHKLEAFAAIAARIIWYLVILAVEFTRATWQKEPEEVQDSEDREEQNKIGEEFLL